MQSPTTRETKVIGRKCDGFAIGAPLSSDLRVRALRIHIPPNYPPETLVLFVMSTWHVLIALIISRVGVLQPERPARPLLADVSGNTFTPEGA